MYNSGIPIGYICTVKTRVCLAHLMHSTPMVYMHTSFLVVCYALMHTCIHPALFHSFYFFINHTKKNHRKHHVRWS